MSSSSHLLDQVEILETERHHDGRGWLHVALRKSQLPPDARLGELYVVHTAETGVRRGDHLHNRATEWFSVVEGRALFELEDPQSGERKEIELEDSPPRTLVVPAGLAHAIINRGPGPMTVVAWADHPHDPEDVKPHSTAPKESL
ncbi:MAG: WxcM-like domain-containing protein [Myxococcota bacterium]|nr:WxcM-like domain-containing protein [Myxococcota bacterium]